MTDERLAEFAQLLRQNGLRVSPGELADAARALALVPFEERAAVHAALRATLVKRGQDAATFDRLFELFFGATGRLLEGLEETLARALSMDGLTLEEMQQVAEGLAELQLQGSAMTQAVLAGRLGEIAKLLRAAALKVDFRGLKSGLQKGFYARRVGQAAGLGDVSREFERLEESLAARGLDATSIERVSQRLNEAMEALEETAKRVSDLEFKVRDRESLALGTDGAVHRTIATLTPQEVQRMRLVVKRLAEKLKSRIARKRRERRRGQLHVRRTLRRNMALGGLPAHLAFRQKRPERPDIVVLCDVSDSVRNVSRLMLQFLHTLQALYARVRTFAFVSDLAEITELLKSSSVDEAVDGAIAARVLNLSANSNYGHALRQFHDDFRGAVTSRTTLLVVGDGRSNYNPANAWVLAELKQKAKRVVWLCPEEQSAWGFGDSEMSLYARHCTRVLVVRTVEELARVGEEILP